MQRLATTVAIAAWIGFLGVFSIELVADALAPGLLAAAAGVPWPPALSAQFDGIDSVLTELRPTTEVVIGVVCLAIVTLFAWGLRLLQASRRARIDRGEVLVLIGVGAIAVLACLAQVTSTPLLPIDLGGGLVWLSIGLTLAAIGFDRLVAIETDDERESDARFHAEFAVLAERMARQTALYTVPEPRRTDPRKDGRP